MKKLILVLLGNLFSFMVFAQTGVTIKVVDAKTGEPVPHVSIKIKGTGKGAITNSAGVCVVQAPANSVIELSSIGYSTDTVTLHDQSEITVQLQAVTVDLSDIVVTGTRGAPRAKLETPVPVDVIRTTQVGLTTAKMELASVLNITAPSFNYNKQTGADGADHIDLGTLRGLGPDQTLS